MSRAKYCAVPVWSVLLNYDAKVIEFVQQCFAYVLLSMANLLYEKRLNNAQCTVTRLL